MNFTYEFAKSDDRVPMIDFLESLSIKERAKIFAAIDKLIELKNHALQPKENLSKHLDDGIFELRVSFEKRNRKRLKAKSKKLELFVTHGEVKDEYRTNIFSTTTAS